MEGETEKYHVVAELEENGGRGEVPELIAAVAEAVDAFVDADHADFGERRDEVHIGRRGGTGRGTLACEGVERNERTLLGTQKDDRRVIVRTRNVHGNRVLVDNVID